MTSVTSSLAWGAEVQLRPNTNRNEGRPLLKTLRLLPPPEEATAVCLKTKGGWIGRCGNFPRLEGGSKSYYTHPPYGSSTHG